MYVFPLHIYLPFLSLSLSLSLSLYIYIYILSLYILWFVALRGEVWRVYVWCEGRHIIERESHTHTRTGCTNDILPWKNDIPCWTPCIIEYSIPKTLIALFRSPMCEHAGAHVYDAKNFGKRKSARDYRRERESMYVCVSSFDRWEEREADALCARQAARNHRTVAHPHKELLGWQHFSVGL
jgi:hypothetical protein